MENRVRHIASTLSARSRHHVGALFAGEHRRSLPLNRNTLGRSRMLS